MRLPFFDRWSVLRSAVPSRTAAAESGTAWASARNAHPRLAEDVLRLGGVLAMQPATYVDGIASADPVDPHRLAYEAGRRDLAVQLLTLMGISNHDLFTLMETTDDRYTTR